MEVISQSWEMFADTMVCSCSACQESHKLSFFAGALAFMRNMQEVTADAEGVVDVGRYIDAQTQDIDAFLRAVRDAGSPGHQRCH